MQAEGDYVRLRHRRAAASWCARHSREIEERWGQHGFVRVHRSYVVEPQPRRRDPAAARRHGRDRDGRRQRGAGRPPPGRRPAPEVADVIVPPARPSLPPAAAAPRLRSPREELAEATAHGHVYLRGLRRAQLRCRCWRWSRSARSSACCRWRCTCSRASTACTCSGCRCGLWIVVVPMLPAVRRDRLALRAPRGRARRRVPRAGRAVDRRAARGRCRHARHARPRHVGRAVRAHDLGPARRRARGDALVERGGDLRRVPVGGELPRDRRARDADRRERAVAVARLHRRIPGAAAVRGGAAAPLRLLHDPRLRRGAPAQPAAAAARGGDRAR